MTNIMATPKIIRGCWQLANGHSAEGIQTAPIKNAIQYGFNTFDCADIYTGVEELLGKVKSNSLRIHTKFVPDLARLTDIDNKYIESIIDRSRTRLNVDCLDLVQFHWWDWEIKKYLHAMEILEKLQAQGKIAAIGLTNVNSKYLQEFANNFAISSVQSQVSLFDNRISRGISDVAKQHKIKVFAYGTLLGGFLHKKWLEKPEPNLGELANRSLIKYKLLIDDACGWSEFQKRLAKLQQLANKYECSIANIAMGALLQTQLADSLIVGLSPTNFAKQNADLKNLPRIAKQDLNELNNWQCKLRGDAYEAERDKNSMHAKIMKYNLNTQN